MAESLPTESALAVLELNHVALYVRDLEASVRFYGEVLGLPPLVRPAFDFGGAWFALGSQELHLIQDTQNQDKERHSLHVAFLVEDAAACAEALRGRGVTSLRGPSPRPDGAAQVFLSDPDGYLLEITSRPRVFGEQMGQEPDKSEQWPINSVSLIERAMTDAEFARMNAGFDEHTREQGNPLETSERHGFVALNGETFIGCASGLVYKVGEAYNGWFYLTDLFVEKPHRGRGLGAELLRRLEDKVAALGVTNFWTFTAGYEAPGFYQKQGYTIIFEQADWYATGHSRVALSKTRGPERPESKP